MATTNFENMNWDGSSFNNNWGTDGTNTSGIANGNLLNEGGGGNWFSDINWLGSGKKGDTGVLIPGLDAVSGLTNAWTGMQNLKLGRDQFDTSKAQFNTNLANQATLTNAQMQDQVRARMQGTGQYAGNTTQLEQDLASYMDANRVSGAPV